MSRRTTALAVAVALCGAGLVPQIAAPVASAATTTSDSAGDWTGRRLVTNGDFEAPVAAGGAGAGIPGWSTSSQGRFVRVVHGEAVQGRQSLTIRNVRPHRGETARSERIAVLPGESLTVSAWARQVSGAAGLMTVQFHRADGSEIEEASGQAQKSASGARRWAEVIASRVAPDDATTASVVLSEPGVGTSSWDDIRVTSVAPSAYHVPDGSFEDTRDDQIHTHWTYTGEVRKQGGDVWSGDRALEVVGTSGAESSAASFPIPVVAGDRITVTAWTRVVDGSPGTLRLGFLAVDRTVVEGSPLDYRTTSVGGAAADAGSGDHADQWHQVFITAEVPEAATHLQLTASSTGSGTTRWDEVRVAGRSDSGVTAYDSTIGDGSVLFVGDQKVESYTGLERVVHPGTKTGPQELADIGKGVVLGYPGTTDSRTVSTVLKDPGGPFRMWFGGGRAGYLESADGLHWDERTATATTGAPGNIVENPRYGAPGQPRYFGMAIGFAESDNVRARTQNYYVYVSDDGITWTRPTPNLPAIYGRDTVMVTWDAARRQFVATVKQWFMPAASPGVYQWEPRSAWVSFSDDFTTWSQPRLVLQSDVRDYRTIAAAHPDKHTTSDIYSLPTFRYGEQVLGLPWMQDVTDISRIVNMGQDVSTEHIELTSSQDYFTWSRPAREPIIAKGKPGEWDWGFTMTSSSGFITEGDTVRLYYGSYAGEHACTAARISAGTCDVLQVPSRIGMVTWKRDRFVSLKSTGSAAGVVTTRVLTPSEAAGRLHLNADGAVRVEVLDAAGHPVPGYGLGASVPVRGDTLDSVATWRGRDHLPALPGGVRLRLHVTGELFSYAIR